MDICSTMVGFIPLPQAGGGLQVYRDGSPPLLHLKMELVEMGLNIVETSLVWECVCVCVCVCV